MSVPILNSLSTIYGSCTGSETDSVLSQQTFKSAKSNSTLFFSGDSDTDTLVRPLLILFNLHTGIIKYKFCSMFKLSTFIKSSILVILGNVYQLKTKQEVSPIISTFFVL